MTDNWHITLHDDLPEENKEVYLRIPINFTVVTGYLGDDGYWHNSKTHQTIPSHEVTGWKEI